MALVVEKLDRLHMLGIAHRAGLPVSPNASPEEIAKALQVAYRALPPSKLSGCDTCHGESPSALPGCAFCGELDDPTKSDELEKKVATRKLAPEPPPAPEPAPESDDDASSEETDEDDRDDVLIGADEHRVTGEVIASLARRADIYQRGGELVGIRTDATPTTKGVTWSEGAPRIRPLSRANLREEITRHVRLVDDDGNEKHPPEWLVRQIHERGEYPGVRPLVGVIDAPTMRADGTILDAAGYDRATGLVLVPSTQFPPVPANASHADAVAARDALLEVVVDFPFRGEADRAAWVSFVLTGAARYAIPGPVPLHALDATNAGTGKGLAADAGAIIATGRPATKTPEPPDDNELRKRALGVLLAGERVVCIDNVERPITWPTLDALLTTWPSWSDRALGRTGNVDAPATTLWSITGNNLSFGRDTIRRTAHIRLESRVERPEERDGFRHADLLEWVRAQRPRLLVAALTLLRAFVVAGRPAANLKPWGSFERWSAVVRAAIVWVGLPDPALTRHELSESADVERRALVDLLEAWAILWPHGATVAEVLDEVQVDPLQAKPHGPRVDAERLAVVRDAVAALCGGSASRKGIGQRLGKLRGRVVGGRALDATPGRGGIAKWVVRQVEDGGLGCLGGFALTPPQEEGERKLLEGVGTNQPKQPNPPASGEQVIPIARRRRVT